MVDEESLLLSELVAGEDSADLSRTLKLVSGGLRVSPHEQHSYGHYDTEAHDKLRRSPENMVKQIVRMSKPLLVQQLAPEFWPLGFSFLHALGTPPRVSRAKKTLSPKRQQTK